MIFCIFRESAENGNLKQSLLLFLAEEDGSERAGEESEGSSCDSDEEGSEGGESSMDQRSDSEMDEEVTKSKCKYTGTFSSCDHLSEVINEVVRTERAPQQQIV